MQDRFGIILPEDKISFIKINKGYYLHPDKYKVLTLFLQAVTSSFVIYECLNNFATDIMVDTMGFGWIYPIAKLCCPDLKIISYSHYPFISSDMIKKVQSGISDFNNQASISKSKIKTQIKLCYYKLILLMYRFVGRFADLIMANSTWTFNHFADLWASNLSNLYKLFPPCTVDKYYELPLNRPRAQQILSIGQFRPEKNHKLQINAIKQIVESDPVKYKNVKLVIAGSCRAKDDEDRQKDLENYVNELGLKEHVIFKKNVSWNELYELMRNSMIGLHTMQDEHFGIVVVELIAAGLVTIAHRSAGPKYDIIQENSLTDPYFAKGFLAETESEFVTHIKYVLDYYGSKNIDDLMQKAREHSKTFSDQAFINEFNLMFDKFMLKNYETGKSKKD